MNPISKLLHHHARHIYKRGRYKGDAPLDSSRRHRNHIRVVKTPNAMIVQMYSTDILTANHDGTVVITYGGWDTPTTRQALNEALRITNLRAWVCRERVSNFSQTVLKLRDNTTGEYRSYPMPVVLVPGEGGYTVLDPKPLRGFRVDREEAKAWREQFAPFMQMLPMLYPAVDKRWPLAGFPRVEHVIDDPDQWLAIASLFAFKGFMSTNKRTLDEAKREIRQYISRRCRHLVDIPQ